MNKQVAGFLYGILCNQNLSIGSDDFPIAADLAKEAKAELLSIINAPDEPTEV